MHLIGEVAGGKKVKEEKKKKYLQHHQRSAYENTSYVYVSNSARNTCIVARMERSGEKRKGKGKKVR